MSFEGILEAEFFRLGLAFPKGVRGKLGVYLEELLRWSKRINLTSLEGEQLVRRLVAEPAWIGEELQLSGSLADIGSGNGSPGIPLCVTRNLREMHLVEARSKRAAFLRHVASRLQLQEIVVYRCRAEDLVGDFDFVDWITLQAVSPTPGLIGGLRQLFLGTTRVVWITSGGAAPVSGASQICVPGSRSEAWVFRLEQF